MIFKLLRIIGCQIMIVEGVGKIILFVDMKYERNWAKRYPY